MIIKFLFFTVILTYSAFCAPARVEPLKISQNLLGNPDFEVTDYQPDPKTHSKLYPEGKVQFWFEENQLPIQITRLNEFDPHSSNPLFLCLLRADDNYQRRKIYQDVKQVEKMKSYELGLLMAVKGLQRGEEAILMVQMNKISFKFTVRSNGVFSYNYRVVLYEQSTMRFSFSGRPSNPKHCLIGVSELDLKMRQSNLFTTPKVLTPRTPKSAVGGGFTNSPLTTPHGSKTPRSAVGGGFTNSPWNPHGSKTPRSAVGGGFTNSPWNPHGPKSSGWNNNPPSVDDPSNTLQSAFF